MSFVENRSVSNPKVSLRAKFTLGVLLIPLVLGAFQKSARAFFPEPLILTAILAEGGSFISEAFRESKIRKALPHALAVMSEEDARAINGEKTEAQSKAVRERAHERVIENRRGHNRWAEYTRTRNEKKKESWFDFPLKEEDLPRNVEIDGPVTEAELSKQLGFAAGDLRWKLMEQLKQSGAQPPVMGNKELDKARARMASLYSGDYYSVVEFTGMNLVFFQLGSPLMYDDKETAAAIIHLNQIEREIALQKLAKKAAKAK